MSMLHNSSREEFLLLYEVLEVLGYLKQTHRITVSELSCIPITESHKVEISGRIQEAKDLATEDVTKRDIEMGNKHMRRYFIWLVQFSSVAQRVRLFATPWIAARQASLSITNSQSLPKLMSIELVMPFSIPFSSCPHPLPASGSFQMSQLFAWGGQSIGVSASAPVLPKNTRTDLL